MDRVDMECLGWWSELRKSIQSVSADRENQDRVSWPSYQFETEEEEISHLCWNVFTKTKWTLTNNKDAAGSYKEETKTNRSSGRIICTAPEIAMNDWYAVPLKYKDKLVSLKDDQ